MFPLRSIRLAVFALCVSTGLASGAERPSTGDEAFRGKLKPLRDPASGAERLTIGDRLLFAWFDELGLEDLTHARLVRVRTGYVTGTSSDGKDERLPDEPRAFLLWEKDGKFRAVLGDLTVATFTRAGTDPKKDDYVGWRAVTPEDETAASLLVLTRKEFDAFWDDGHDTYFDRMELDAQAFVLARYCASNGREDLAASLLRATEQRFRKEKDLELKEALEEGIGSALAWRATLAWADPQQDRHALAALLQKVVKHCPQVYRADWMTTTAAALEQMAREDDTHAKLSAAEFAGLTPPEQARELVFQLRDDNENFEENWPRPWPFVPTRGNGAMKKLEALGLPAVPALLEALNDERPTRSVFRNDRYGGGAWPFLMDDLASTVLTEIAGVNFRALAKGRTYEESWDQTRVLAKDWWKTTQEKGDTAWLRARIAEGNDDSPYCLDDLAKRHPDVLVGLVTGLVPTMKNPHPRAAMLERLDGVRTPEVDTFLFDEMAHGPTLENRVAAARLLSQRHRPEALAAMLAELPAQRKLLTKDPASADVPGFVQFGPAPFSGEPNSPFHLLAFLLRSDSAEAVRAVQDTLALCPIHGRCELIDECGQRLSDFGIATIGPASRATSQTIEALLISELKDEDVLAGENRAGAPEPKLAEIAAMHLASLWPAKYEFKIGGSPQLRAGQLAAIRAKAAAQSKLPDKAAALTKQVGTIASHA